MSILDNDPATAPVADQSKVADTPSNDALGDAAATSPKTHQADKSSIELTRRQKHIAKKMKAMEINESNQGQEMISVFHSVLKAKGREITVKDSVLANVNVVVGIARE